MSIDTVFKPTGPTVLVVNAAQQISNQNTGGVYSMRVVNLASTVQRFSWGSSQAAVTALAGNAPTSAGTPGTITMIGNSVETFEIPVTSWIIASTATGFEFTPGQGA